jgi:hypothetical protein
LRVLVCGIQCHFTEHFLMYVIHSRDGRSNFENPF